MIRCSRRNWVLLRVTHGIVTVTAAVIIVHFSTRRLLSSDGYLSGEVWKEDNIFHTEFPLSENHQVVYIRIPKTGSSTLTLLLWRFAWTRNLTVVSVNPTSEGFKPFLSPDWFFLPPADNTFDMMAEHVIYHKQSFGRFFQKRTVYITLLREPMSLLVSTLYYIDAYRNSIPAEDKLKGYLENASKYDKIPVNRGHSFTKNPQSSFLGLKQKDFDNMTKIRQLVVEINQDFPLVLILEKLDESLVLLRRILNWPIKDLIYSIQNVNHQKPAFEISAEQREKYKQLSKADHVLYTFFRSRLEEYIREGGLSFQEELAAYRRQRSDVTDYCNSKVSTALIVAETPNNEAFSVTRKDCSLIRVQPLLLLSSLRKRQGFTPYLSPGVPDELVSDFMQQS